MQTTVQMAWCKRPAPRLIRQDNVVAIDISQKNKKLRTIAMCWDQETQCRQTKQESGWLLRGQRGDHDGCVCKQYAIIYVRTGKRRLVLWVEPNRKKRRKEAVQARGTLARTAS